jgi:hypothetical protein
MKNKSGVDYNILEKRQQISDEQEYLEVVTSGLKPY